MPTAKPTYDEIVASLQEYIQTSTGLNNFAEGSVIGAIITAIAQNQSTINDLISQVETARDIELATGQDLDNLGRSLGGLLRRPATSAGSDSSAAQLLVTNNSANASLLFPKGTAVWSSANPSNRFYASTSVTVPDQGSTAVFVSALQTGASYNVAEGQIDSHNADSNFVVTNFLPITGGSDLETDDEFRYRIAQTLKAAVLGGQSSSTGMILALTALPGVSDVVLRPEARGPGTVDAVIVPLAGYLPDDDFLTSCTEEMARTAAAGISVRALAPTTVPIGVEVGVSTTGQSASLSPQAPITSLVTQVVQSYINSRSVMVSAVDGVVNPYNTGTDPTDSMIDYSLLLSNVTNAVRSILGNAVQNVTLSFTVGSVTDQSVQGDVYARSGEVLRTRSVRVVISYSS